MVNDIISKYKREFQKLYKEIEALTDKVVMDLLTELINRYKDDTNFLIEELKKFKEMQRQCEKEHGINCPLLKPENRGEGEE